MGIIRTALTNLEQGIKGLVVMTMELENTFQCIFDGRVPPTWLKVCLVLFYFKKSTKAYILQLNHFT